MTILALDIGKARTGIAVSDPSGRVASPLTTLPTEQVVSGSKSFRDIVGDYGEPALLVGLPVSMDGEEHAQAAWVREVAQGIAELFGLPLIFADERRSSAQAEATLREMGYNSRSMRSRIDMVAACIFLQSYLDGANQKTGG